MVRPISAVERLGIATRGYSFFHRVRGAAIQAWREGRRVEIRLGKNYPAIFFLCRDLIRRQYAERLLKEEDTLRVGVGLILDAMAEDQPDSNGSYDFGSLRVTCRLSESGRVGALYIKPRRA